MARRPKVAIIGGGIGGLTAALAMLRRDIDVTVYEQSAAIGEIGAGVTLSPNAVKAYRGLGIDDQIASIGFEADYSVLRSWDTGNELSREYRRGVYESEYGAPYFSLHRADLIDVLSRNVPENIVRLGSQCTSVETGESGACAKFGDGSEIEADLIVGADGIHSNVRKSLFGSIPPRFTGSACWRGLVPYDALPPGLVSKDLTIYMGPRSHVIHYMVRRGELVNFVAHVETDSWTGESWTQECPRTEVMETFAGWHEPLRVLLSKSEQNYKWAIYDRDPLRSWTKGRITLLGDAAHPMPPFIGQGGCMAIEDGYILAAMISQHADDLGQALRSYERHRVPRTTSAVLQARARGEEMHVTSIWARMKRHVGIALRKKLGGDRTGMNLKAFYDYDVVEAARTS